MTAAVWIVDAQTLRIVEVNAAALTLSGLPRDALVGHGVTALAATPEDLAFWADADAGLDDRLLSDSLLRRADGSIVPVTRHVCPIEHGGRRAFRVELRQRQATLPRC